MRTALEAIAAVSGSAVFFGVQKYFEVQHGWPSYQHLPLGLVAGTVSTLVLRWAILSLPTKCVYGRRLIRKDAPLEGMWLEQIDRRGEVHYSLFCFKYDAAIDKYVMIGTSYYADGREHSTWSTAEASITTPLPSGFDVDYIYTAKLVGSTEGGKVGSGHSSFRLDPATHRLRSGSGYYISTEEDGLHRCGYRLYRIDRGFKSEVGVGLEDLATDESKRRSITIIHEKLSRTACID